MNRRTVNKPVTKKTSTVNKSTTIDKKVGTQSMQPSTNKSNPIDKFLIPAVFPLKFIEIPLNCFKRSSNGEIQHELTRKQIEDILTDYKFHSFNASFNRGQIILCFEKI